MPYKRYKRRPKFGYGRKRASVPWYNRKYNVMDVAKQAWKGVKFIKGLINVEKRYFDVDGTAGTSVSSSGTVIPLSQIAAGNDVNNRSGNSILAKTIYMRLECAIHASASQTSVRVMIVKDMMNTGSTPAVTDILQSAGTLLPLNVDNTSRWQVLLDKVYTLTVDGIERLAIKKFLPINDHIKFTGTAATDEYKNNMYMLLVSSEPTNTPSVAYYSRLGFYDN